MVTSVETYLDTLCEAYPTVSRGDIKRIVEYGWRLLYYYNLRGCDTVIVSQTHKYWFYIGQLTKDSVAHFRYYSRILRRKIRVLYSKKKIEWNGYYYVGLTDEEAQEFKSILNQKGRKRKYFTFKDKVALKIFDEAKLYYSWSKCIIKYKYPMDLGFSYRKEELNCEDPKIALERDNPATFKDILISNNNYEIV